ncbi:hypothetical protein FJ960_14795 [Mesorhizobium sp. B2-3-11]|uniref:hypothetical protein n=1 Tax=Mesorhizobium sp. B2-3-11 TaxID=2589953 RepID=UPI001127AB86|nr:hypothetical protein [Mesorhizobium sp. B2-3-11]TPM03741.1 hypothetical protein FJ960_14795 [Mesorhizobium sp. B2-3-11]
MRKPSVFLCSIVLTLATSAVPFATVADAAVTRHHYVRVTTAHNGHTRAANRGHGHRYGWVGSGWTVENSTDNSNWMDSYYNGYGSYRGYAGDFCGTIAWTLDICSPHGP